MADIEPAKIWAVTGLLVISICGMTEIQLRSNGSSFSEMASLTKTPVNTLLTTPSLSTPAEYSIYAASYTGGSAFRRAASNPLVTSTHPLFFNRSIPSGSNSDAEEEEDAPDSDVASEIVTPEFADDNTGEAAADTLNLLSANYNYTTSNLSSPDMMQQSDEGLLLASNTIPNVYSDDYANVMLWSVDNSSTQQISDMADLDGIASNQDLAIEGAPTPDAQAGYLTADNGTANILGRLVANGKNLSNINMPAQAQAMALQQLFSQQGGSGNQAQAMAIQQAVAAQQAQAEGLAYQQQAQADGPDIAYQQAQANAQQQAQGQAAYLNYQQSTVPQLVQATFEVQEQAIYTRQIQVSYRTGALQVLNVNPRQ